MFVGRQAGWQDCAHKFLMHNLFVCQAKQHHLAHKHIHVHIALGINCSIFNISQIYSCHHIKQFTHTLRSFIFFFWKPKVLESRNFESGRASLPSLVEVALKKSIPQALEQQLLFEYFHTGLKRC